MRRRLTLAVFAILALFVLPQLATATSSSGGGVESAAFLTGCVSPTVSAEEAPPESTQIASVLRHTEVERMARDRRARAQSQQEARASGYTLDRVLEIALHPMFLLVLAIPLFRKLRSA